MKAYAHNNKKVVDNSNNSVAKNYFGTGTKQRKTEIVSKQNQQTPTYKQQPEKNLEYQSSTAKRTTAGLD